MSFNPFDEKPVKIEKTFMDWKKMCPKPYDKKTVDPYTRTRIILMNGTEFEANWFSHGFSRRCTDNNLRRELALIRRVEQQQQKEIAALKPLDETILETTIGYEQLAVDLTAILAKHVKDKYVKKALDFALLEDFDHLYRFANLLEMDSGVDSKTLVGCYTEMTPARPTIAHHRFPTDSIKKYINSQKSDTFTNLTTSIITAAEQQTMNWYMNIGATYPTEMGRKLFSEIAMVEEEHVSLYGSLMDTTCTDLEEWLMHEYTECYLYYSCVEDETDPYIKKIWENHLTQEIAHLHKVKDLLMEYEGTDYRDVIKDPVFPAPIKFSENKEYVRKVIKTTVNNTECGEEYCKVSELPEKNNFKTYQNIVNKSVNDVASHVIIDKYIKSNGQDYRYEDSPNPIPELRDRHKDNTEVGRK